MSFAKKSRTGFAHLMSFALLLSFATGCQRAAEEETSAVQEAPMVMGQDDDGNKVMYGIACLRKNAAQIQQDGKSAAKRCLVQPIDQASYERGVRGTAKTEYTYIYYPYSSYWYPPYWGDNQSSNYNNGRNGFCSQIFGVSWGTSSNNCISSIFGWSDSTSNGNTSTCAACAYRSNPNRCYQRNGCWTNSSYNYYWSPYYY